MDIKKAAITILILITCMVVSGEITYADDSSLFPYGYVTPSPKPLDPIYQPPSAYTLKFKPDISNGFKPYLGTGVAYSLTSHQMLGETKNEIKAGVAGNAGFSYLLGKNSFLNFDYKYLYLAPDAKHVNEGVTPQLFGIGFDLKF